MPEKIIAVVTIAHRGSARVEVDGQGLLGTIRRLGVQHYAAFDREGSVAGKAARYESAARTLARHYGLCSRTTPVGVDIVHLW